MVTKTQINRLCSRIEALAPKPDRVAYLWRDRHETIEDALERHYRAFPTDRLAAQMYIFSWQRA